MVVHSPGRRPDWWSARIGIPGPFVAAGCTAWSGASVTDCCLTGQSRRCGWCSRPRNPKPFKLTLRRRHRAACAILCERTRESGEGDRNRLRLIIKKRTPQGWGEVMADFGESKQATAFSQGCDARLSGLPMRSNPYRDCADRWLAQAFRSGWRHCDLFWGDDAKWPVITLPRCQTCATSAGVISGEESRSSLAPA